MDYLEKLAYDTVDNIQTKGKIEDQIDLADFYDYYYDDIIKYLENYPELTDDELTTVYEYIDAIVSNEEYRK